jgi:heme exporter protein A
MIEVIKLGKVFGGKKVLRGVNFNASAGEFIALLGPNGAGKSTFLRILASLLRPTSGQVRIAGYRLPQEATSFRSHLGVVTHQPLLYGELTAVENLRFFGRLYGINNLYNRVNEVLALVGLTMRNQDLVRTFSRGMQQKLSIGRAILHDPDVLLFDEPHTGLDPDACDMLDKLLKSVATRGRTVVLTSHDLSRVESLANRFDVLTKGVISTSVKRDDFHGNLLDYYREAINS